MAAAGASSAKTSKFEDAAVNAPVVDYSQTKADGVELWAIRLPPGFDASRLDGLMLNSDGAMGDGFTVRAAPTAESGSIIPAFPSAKKNRWVLGKSFARQLVVALPPPDALASAAVPPPPLPPVPQVRNMRLCRPYPEITSPAAPPPAAATAASTSAPPAATRKRAEAPAAAGKAGKADKKARTRR